MSLPIPQSDVHNIQFGAAKQLDSKDGLFPLYATAVIPNIPHTAVCT